MSRRGRVPGSSPLPPPDSEQLLAAAHYLAAAPVIGPALVAIPAPDEIEPHDGQPEDVALPDHPIRIGRDPRAGVVLDDVEVSGWHAQIVPVDASDGGGFDVVDDESSNGVRVNGQRIVKRARLAHADWIGIGPFRFLFVSAGRVFPLEADVAGKTDSPRRSWVTVVRPSWALLLEGGSVLLALLLLGAFALAQAGVLPPLEETVQYVEQTWRAWGSSLFGESS